jgi:hypothetical protein
MTMRFPITALTAALALAAGAADAAPKAFTLKAVLSGAAEKPQAGDPKGSGKVTLHVDPAKDQICYQLQVKGIGPATMAHVHMAPPNESGPPLAQLQPPGADGKSSGCVAAGPVLLKGLQDNPAAYYVNVHNDAYKGGALRGQLHR